MKPQKRKTVLWSVSTALCALLCAALIVGYNIAMTYATTVNMYLGTADSKSVNITNDRIFDSDFENEDARWEYEKELCAQIEEEGAVLLVNENNALPLASGDKVTLFSHASVDVIYGGTGSGKVDVSNAPNFKEALEGVGISVNETVWDWYTRHDEYSRTVQSGISDVLSANTLYAVNEAPWSEVEAAAGDSIAEYGDAAIMVIARAGGEGADLPDGDESFEIDGLSYAVGTENGDYLALTEEEKSVLAGMKELKDAGTIKKIIVVLNMSNGIEMSFLKENYGIDAVLWVGDVGQTGLNGVAAVLAGEVSPSGSLADTYWYDNQANPAVINFYSRAYKNGTDYSFSYAGPDGDETDTFACDDARFGNQLMYSVYQEGIYLGYRYTETRYEDAVMGTGNAGEYDYASAVAFPFGYGLSYTDFDITNFEVEEKGDNFVVTAVVTNIGNAAGKKTFQVWFQSPYTEYDRENGIEKASVELCGFTKTQTLEPGASEEVTVIVPKTELRTYDANNAKTYILDAGTYYFTAGSSAHEAINNILAAKGYTTGDGMTEEGKKELVSSWEQDELDTQIFSVSATGNTITNLFEEADPDKSSVSPGKVTWLSRSDWEGTWPSGDYGFTMNEALAQELVMSDYDASEYADEEMPVMGAENGLTLASMLGASYEDPNWELLIQEMTYEELVNIITLGFHNTGAAASISKPATKDENGPQGLTASLTGGASAMCYTSEDVLAATFNTELIHDVGRCIGNDCLDMGYSGLYGPGVNIHRTPYSGRNFEYYSEDPCLAGEICAAEVQGIQSKGVYVYLKHVALNDSETSRQGVGIWLNEQAAREIYLEDIDKAVTKGGAWSVMSGYNRWGSQWCGEYKNLITGYLVDEIGLPGMIITDYSGSSAYMDLMDAMEAGTDLWDSPDPSIHTTLAESSAYRQDPHFVSLLQTAMKDILYTVVNSNAMNGYTTGIRIVSITPWWQTAILALAAVFGLMAVGCFVKMILSNK